MTLSNASKAGVAVFIGGVQFTIGFVLAEIYYPAYNVSTNYISDLGATCPTLQTCIVEQPTSTIFNSSIVLYGLLGLLGAYFLQKAFRWKPATAMVVLGSVGAIGVGLFPETTGVWHSLFSLIVFLFTGLSALVTARLQRKPMLYLSTILGLVSLVALLLYIGGVYLGLGPGGMERVVAWPVILWTVGFGAHLMGLEDAPKR